MLALDAVAVRVPAEFPVGAAVAFAGVAVAKRRLPFRKVRLDLVEHTDADDADKRKDQGNPELRVRVEDHRSVHTRGHQNLERVGRQDRHRARKGAEAVRPLDASVDRREHPEHLREFNSDLEQRETARVIPRLQLNRLLHVLDDFIALLLAHAQFYPRRLELPQLVVFVLPVRECHRNLQFVRLEVAHLVVVLHRPGVDLERLFFDQQHRRRRGVCVLGRLCRKCRNGPGVASDHEEADHGGEEGEEDHGRDCAPGRGRAFSAVAVETEIFFGADLAERARCAVGAARVDAAEAVRAEWARVRRGQVAVKHGQVAVVVVLQQEILRKGSVPLQHFRRCKRPVVARLRLAVVPVALDARVFEAGGARPEPVRPRRALQARARTVPGPGRGVTALRADAAVAGFVRRVAVAAVRARVARLAGAVRIPASSARLLEEETPGVALAAA